MLERRGLSLQKAAAQGGCYKEHAADAHVIDQRTEGGELPARMVGMSARLGFDIPIRRGEAESGLVQGARDSRRRQSTRDAGTILAFDVIIDQPGRALTPPPRAGAP